MGVDGHGLLFHVLRAHQRLGLDNRSRAALGGLWLGWIGAIEGRLAFGLRRDWLGLLGGLLIVYALIAYPLIGPAVGPRYPAMPTFGLPCPVTIFTVGALLLTLSPVPRSVFIAPAAWGISGCRPALRRHHRRRRDGLPGRSAGEQRLRSKPAGRHPLIRLAIGALGPSTCRRHFRPDGCSYRPFWQDPRLIMWVVGETAIFWCR